jgi:hypothetical protein
MRQIMPHRNNIAMRRTKRKRYFLADGARGKEMKKNSELKGCDNGPAFEHGCDIIILNNAL